MTSISYHRFLYLVAVSCLLKKSFLSQDCTWWLYYVCFKDHWPIWSPHWMGGQKSFYLLHGLWEMVALKGWKETQTLIASLRQKDLILYHVLFLEIGFCRGGQKPLQRGVKSFTKHPPTENLKKTYSLGLISVSFPFQLFVLGVCERTWPLSGVGVRLPKKMSVVSQGCYPWSLLKQILGCTRLTVPR